MTDQRMPKPLRCSGCGQEVSRDEVGDDAWHLATGHAPECWGTNCERNGCPVQVQCGPVVEVQG